MTRAGWLSVLAAATVCGTASAGQFDKPSILGDPGAAYQAQRPSYGPLDDAIHIQQPTFAPPSAPITTPQISIKVPSTQIGLQNPTASDVAAVVELGNGQSRVVLLKAHQSETIDCRTCSGALKAIVPRGSAPAADDFALNVSPGNVYQFKYDSAAKRWILVQQ